MRERGGLGIEKEKICKKRGGEGAKKGKARETET